MNKDYCTKCGQELVLKGKPFQYAKMLFCPATGEPIYYQEYRCPSELKRWFPQHDVNTYRIRKNTN